MASVSLKPRSSEGQGFSFRNFPNNTARLDELPALCSYFPRKEAIDIPRAAGDGSHYELAVLNGAGAPVGKSTYLPSVTSILEALPKYLQWWGYKLGVEATLDFMNDLPAGEPLPDVEELYKKLKEEKKITPATVLTSAGTRGSDVHAYAEAIMRGESLSVVVDKSVTGYCKAVDTFKEEFDKQGWITKEVEIPVYSLQHRYAGTTDVIAYHPGMDVHGILDFKTSKAIYESNFLQMEAYDFAAREMGYYDGVSKRIVVRLGAKGKYEMKESTCGIDDFLAVKRVWEWLEKMKALSSTGTKSVSS